MEMSARIYQFGDLFGDTVPACWLLRRLTEKEVTRLMRKTRDISWRVVTMTTRD